MNCSAARPPGPEAARQAVEERGPVRLSHRLDHLDADDRIERLVDVAVVLLAVRDRAIATRVLAPGDLLVGQAHGGYLRAAIGQGDGERSPAAADLQHLARAGDPVGDRVELAPLRRLQRIVHAGEQRARVAHRRIEPGGVEVVAEIVVRVDVAPRARSRVAVNRVQRARRPAPRSARPCRAAQRLRVGDEQREQRHRVGAVPLAGLPRLVPTDRAASCQPHQRARADELDRGGEARCAAAEQADGAVGQYRLDAAAGEPRIDAVEHAVESARPQPRQPARTQRQAAAPG